MAKSNHLAQLAEELEALLNAAPARPEVQPAIDESYLIAAEPQTTPVDVPDNGHLIPQLVRSVIEYTLSRSPEGASPEHIGGAVTAGLIEAATHLGLDRNEVSEAVDDFLTELGESVHRSLGV